MKFWQLIIVIVLGFILVKCAQPRPVTGGNKDVTPPKIVKSYPINQSINFTGQSFMLEFDEYVIIKSLSSELVVSPPLKHPVEYKVKGKRVYFEISDLLHDNTTYNFNFGNAIVDLNEGNPLDSNLFVFSTGTAIDSGFISGVVKDSYTQKPIKNAVVMLYPTFRDSAVYNGKPKYIAKTNANGEYELKYLSDQLYQIFALEHSSSDFQYKPYANVGFYTDNVHPFDGEPIDLFLFHEKDTTQYLSKEFSKDYFSFILGFHKDLIQPKFSLTPTSDSVQYVIEEIQPDSFKFWVKGDLDLDSVFVTISDESGFMDTVKMDLDSRKKFYKKLKKKDQTDHPLKVSLNVKAGILHYFDTLKLNFSRPLSSWDVTKIRFVQGTDTMKVDSLMKENTLTTSLPNWTTGTTKKLRSTTLHYPWKPDQKYAFIFYEGAFTDIIKQQNDTSIINFRTQTFEDYGSFRFTVNVPLYNEQVLIELLDSKGKFIRNYFIKSGDVIYHELAIPGKYQIRLILDRNHNGKWDTGNLSTQTQPEEVIYYKGNLEIKSNWDMEETWNVELK